MIRPGETYLWGKNPTTATALLAAAARLGVDPIMVRTTDSGFIAPDAVADEAAADLQVTSDTEPALTAPPEQEF